ncbi:hypothetical protein CDCA_CDCA17G4455 [Cyanidium caldarium]|uniref:Cystathionine beta-synthase n=1 Tax=Cyanidium caldarium TaxID=2771 RepID=A0AAV9J1H1_CYACA|nr:hypothetical protein CDCA_CDCA17G4455 [Cyanidium caldarium]
MTGTASSPAANHADATLERDAPSPALPSRTAPPLVHSILECIGNTPLVRLHNIERSVGLRCHLYAKCEYFNAGGSVKDRIGVRMLVEAERAGRVKPGDTLIEPTSGNTGIGIALVAAARGYRCIITMPEKMSEEKVNILKLLGAEIVRTPTEAAYDSPESHISVARRLNAEIPHSFILDQYRNEDNVLAHYYGTAEEILAQVPDGRVDVLVAGVGTGGTITGCARRFREGGGACTVVGVDPVGSLLAQPDALNEAGVHPYAVEGIGYDFIPQVLDRSVVDWWVKTDDRESFLAARRLMREEGLLVGGSSGSALVGALRAIAQLGWDQEENGKQVVVILPDGCRNYMAKFVSDAWMERQGFLEVPAAPQAWEQYPVSRLCLRTPVTVVPSLPCGEAVNILAENGVDQLPVVGADGAVLGVVTEGNLLAQLASKRVQHSDPVSKAMFRQYASVTPWTTLGELSRMFKYDHFAIVQITQREYRPSGESVLKQVVSSVCTPIDMLDFLVREDAQQQQQPATNPADRDAAAATDRAAPDRSTPLPDTLGNRPTPVGYLHSPVHRPR